MISAFHGVDLLCVSVSLYLRLVCVSRCLLHISRPDLWRFLYKETDSEMWHQHYNDAKILEESGKFSGNLFKK